jgi:predicted flap endonuclease-1-like 5' DNA nuclease
VPANATDKAKLAAAGPEPDSGVDPDLTLISGISPAASHPLAAKSKVAQSKVAQSKQDERAEQDEKPGEAEPAGPDPSMEVTVVPGVPRYHNAHCILIRFMGDSDLDKMTLAAARDVGCTPCRACLPDQPEKSPE